MSSEVDNIKAAAKRYMPNGPGKLDRNHVQKELTLDFILAFLLG